MADKVSALEHRVDVLRKMNAAQGRKLDKQAAEIGRLKKQEKSCDDCHYKRRCEQYSAAAISAAARSANTKARW